MSPTTGPRGVADDPRGGRDVGLVPHPGAARAAEYASRIVFSGPPEEVLGRLTDPARIGQWWTSATGSGVEGGTLLLDFGHGAPLTLGVATARSTLVVWDVLACPFLPDWEGTSLVFDLGRDGDGHCDMFFRHHGLDPRLDCYDTCRQGWDHFLRSLQDLVDTGVGSPRDSVADRARRA
jgi:hypothetical protein